MQNARKYPRFSKNHPAFEKVLNVMTWRPRSAVVPSSIRNRFPPAKTICLEESEDPALKNFAGILSDLDPLARQIVVAVNGWGGRDPVPPGALARRHDMTLMKVMTVLRYAEGRIHLDPRSRNIFTEILARREADTLKFARDYVRLKMRRAPQSWRVALIESFLESLDTLEMIALQSIHGDAREAAIAVLRRRMEHIAEVTRVTDPSGSSTLQAVSVDASP